MTSVRTETDTVIIEGDNMDHSILTGLYAAENIMGKRHDIWAINTDQEYHESCSR